jgi:hypothetical protein
VKGEQVRRKRKRERERERKRKEKSSSFLVGSVEIACRGLDWRETRIRASGRAQPGAL